MPYIAVKGYPKDEETKRRIVERINEVFLELWGCPQEAINISVEEIPPERWEDEIERGELARNADKLYLRAGKKQYADKRLTVFYLSSCPFCRKARQALDELSAEDPAYAAVPIDWVEESERPEIAERYDYFSVPSVFSGQEKLYECKISDSYDEIKANLRRALDTVK